MFCDFNKIKNIIKCKVCSSLVTEEPKILPCGETICSMCSNYEIEVVKNEFDCSVCKKKHEMPKEGLPINKSLLEILLTQPVEVSRGEPAKLLSNSLIEIQKRITHLTNSIENGVDNLKENCFDLKSDVQLVTETAIQMINDFNEKFINKIDDYEKESTKACNENINNNKEFVQTLDKLKSFHNKWTNYLAMPQISDHIITETHKQADEMIKLAENVLVKQDNNIPQLKFIKNDLKLNLNENILGKFILDVRSSVSYAKMVNSNVMAANITRMRSKILSDLQFKELINLCRFAQNKAWNLIYRATQNGFGSNNFHRNCDEKLNTLIIIKSRNGNVFGGYTTQDWSGDGYKRDTNAFIFSLFNQTKIPGKFPCKSPQHAIFCNSGSGPMFGSGRDFRISYNSNVINESVSIPGSYQLPSDTYLAGSRRFLVDEIEVYSTD